MPNTFTTKGEVVNNELRIIGATANCGNSTLGMSACHDLINQLHHKADVLIINCQEVSLDATLSELNHQIDCSELPIGVISSDLRTTRTKMNLHVLCGHTGIATVVLYRTDRISDIAFDRTKKTEVTVNNPNKGALINQLTIQTAHSSETQTVRTISGHLDSNSEAKRIAEWRAIKAATYPLVTNWDSLVAVIPDMQIAGYDANTRNVQTESNTADSIQSANLWHQSALDPKIAPIALAPLGETCYSADNTYYKKKSGPSVIDTKRAGYMQAGSLDFVAIQDNSHIIQDDPIELSTHFITAPISIPNENETIRDHAIVISPPAMIGHMTPFKKVQQYLCNELQYAAPRLAQEMMSLHESHENQSCLLEIYHYYLCNGALLNKIRYIPDSLPILPGHTWFKDDTLEQFNWSSKRDVRLEQMFKHDLADAKKTADRLVAAFNPKRLFREDDPRYAEPISVFVNAFDALTQLPYRLDHNEVELFEKHKMLQAALNRLTNLTHDHGKLAVIKALEYKTQILLEFPDRIDITHRYKQMISAFNTPISPASQSPKSERDFNDEFLL